MKPLSLLFAVLFFVPACSSMGSAPTEVDITGDWMLESGTVDGEPIPQIDGSPVTLNVTGTDLGGTSGCNSYGGQFTLDGSAISIGDLVSTLMACSPEVMAVEVPFTHALSRVDTVAIERGDLVMTGPGIELRFVAAS